MELLKSLGVFFKTKAPTFDERSLSFSGDPVAYCTKLAEQKSLSLGTLDSNLIAITCDTIVFFENQVFNKPTCYQEAFSMLKTFSGKTHRVYSGLCLRKGDQILIDYEVTDVEFNILEDKQIELALQDPRFMHRAGAYTITQKGGLLVKKIEGSYENVIGLPLTTLEKLLRTWDYSLWV